MSNNSLIIAGFMSGTSMDGLDCCISKINIDSNWDFKYKIISSESFKFTHKVKNKIRRYIGAIEYAQIKEIDDFLGRVYLDLSKNFLLEHSFDAIAIHGQTIHHSDKKRSIQVGCPSYLASFFKVPVICQFRKKDILSNGNGAPLMPFLDWLLFKNGKKNIATLNIGGISNLSFIPKNSLKKEVLGFDAGPGMSLIDEYVRKIWRKDCDYNGEYSLNGKINSDLLSFLVSKSSGFIFKKPPKSTGREEFGVAFLEQILDNFKYLNQNDILRTLIKFTSLSLQLNLNNFIKEQYDIDALVVSGGGAKHPILMDDIKKDLDVPILNIINYGIESQIKESLLISVLGYAKMQNIKSNMPSVTGAIKNIVLGEIYEFK